MSSHEEVQDKLLDLAYGELSRREARDVQRHVDGCAECRVALARIQGTRRARAALRPEPAPEKGEGVLLAAARQEAAERHRHRPAPILPGWAWGAALGVVSVAAVVAVSYRIASLRTPPERDDEALIGRAPVPEAPAPAPQAGDAAGRIQPEPAAPPAQRPAPKAPEVAERHRGVQRPPVRREEPREADHPDAEAKRLAAAPTPPATAAPSAPPPASAASRAPQPVAPGAGALAPAPQLEAAPPARLRIGSSRGTRSAAREDDASAAAAEAIARYERLQAGEALRSSTRATAGCPGEYRRQIDRDARGQVVRLLVEGAGGRVEQFYGADGRLAAVRTTSAGSLVILDAPSAHLPRSEVRQDAAPAQASGETTPVRPPAGLIDRAEDVREDAPPRCR